MKKLTTWAIMACSYTFTANAQLALPYENGFDTPAEIEDWAIYRKGITEDEGSTHTWEPMPSAGAVSAPNMLFHDYPVGYGGEELTDDWLVSDKMDMSSGGKLSAKLWVFGVSGGLITGDTIEFYLLSGSRDPGTATKTRIASFAAMFTDSGYIDAPVWRDTADINIPATAGEAYIAFRYTNIFDWFTVGIDDLKIAAGTTTGIEMPQESRYAISLYPNPAQSCVYWNRIAGEGADGKDNKEGVLMNLAGQTILSFRAAAGSLDISGLAPGFYLLRIGNSSASFIKK